ncbi:hypothetical protein [Mycoplasmopsis primatum]|uniref:hypothetical protein n=1 Tax=Mycoplasmopsis primatum TaxID=55604 RepID=UPI000495A7B6|nr:hypothetical protein [Mycoplasmopsis primatum]
MNWKEINEKVNEYRKLGFNEKQLFQIRKGLEHGIDVSSYAYKTCDIALMKLKRELLELEKGMEQWRSQA